MNRVQDIRSVDMRCDISCVISQNLGYTVFSTVGAFYLPLTFIMVVYLNVYRVARSRIHRRQFNRRRDDDRPVAHRDVSTYDPDPDIDTTSQSPGVVWQALRSRLNAISLVLSSTLMLLLPGFASVLVHVLVF